MPDISGYYFEHVLITPFERAYYGGMIPAVFTGEAAISLHTAFNNRMYALPFIEGRGHTYRWIGVRVNTAGASGTTARIGIYTATSIFNLYPNQLVLDAGEVTLNTVSPRARKIFLPFSLDASTLYWLVTHLNIPSIAGSLTTAVGNFNILGCSATDLTQLNVGWFTTEPYGPLPSTFPVGASQVKTGGFIDSGSDSVQPMVYLGVDEDECP